jgi:hypothetical protein
MKAATSPGPRPHRAVESPTGISNRRAMGAVPRAPLAGRTAKETMSTKAAADA